MRLPQRCFPANSDLLLRSTSPTPIWHKNYVTLSRTKVSCLPAGAKKHLDLCGRHHYYCCAHVVEVLVTLFKLWTSYVNV